MPTIWTDSYLNQLQTDAEQRIVGDVPCLYHKFKLATTTGVSVYTLPDKVKSILRITWRGRKVEPVSWEELQILTPGTVYVSNSVKVETSISRPQWYAIHPTNIHDIRFYPTPDETFLDTGDPYSPDTGASCIISCWRNVDLTDSAASLPSYIDRRTRKAYVLWKAFEKEGKGQDSKAALYYSKKYEFLIEKFRRINDGCFVSKKYSIGDGQLEIDKLRYPKPMLPANFERVIY